MVFEIIVGVGVVVLYNLFGLFVYNIFMGIFWVGVNYISSVVLIIFIIVFVV